MGFYTLQNKYLLRCLRYLSRAFQLFRFDSVSGRRIFCTGTVFFNQAVSFFFARVPYRFVCKLQAFPFFGSAFFSPCALAALRTQVAA